MNRTRSALTTNLSPTKDSYVCDGTNAAVNYGAATTMNVKEYQASYDRNAWVSFNIGGLSNVTSATLQVYLSSVGTENSNNVPVSVYYAPTAGDSWGESTLTWNNAPAPGNSPSSPIASQTLNSANAGTWISFDVTSSVAADADGVATFVLSTHAGGSTDHGLLFSTKEGTNPAVLQITTSSDTTAPSVPTGLTATATTASSVSLGWTASTDPDSAVSGYNIYRGATLVGTSTSTSYTDTGLAQNTGYSYTVSAFDPSGNTSAQSTAIGASTTPDTTPPSVPTGLAKTAATTSSISLGWTASTDPDNDFAGYTIFRNGAQVGTSATASYTDTGLSAGTTYSYAVSAYDTLGNASAQSTALNAATSPTTTTVSLTPTKDTQVTDGSNANGNYGTLPTMNLKQNSAGTDKNEWVSFSIAGYSNIQSAKLSLYVSSVGTETTNNVPVSVYYAPTAGDSWGETTLTWNNTPAPGDSPTGGLGTQTVNNASAGTWVTWDVTSSVAADTDGTSTFVLSAWAGGATNHNVAFSTKEGTNAPILQLTTGSPPVDTTPPSVPAGLTVMSSSSSTISLSWTASTDPDSAVSGYKVYRGGTLVGTATSTTYTDASLSPSTTYSYTVSAFDPTGNVSAPCTAVSGTTTSGGFTHPGVVNNATQLAFVKQQLAAGAQPWTAAYNVALADSHAGSGYVDHPPVDTVCATGGTGVVGQVNCGAYSNPDCHCLDQRNDALAAYTDALLWYFSGTQSYADTAIRIMNDWSAAYTSFTGANKVLESAWAGSIWARAAEIIRYTNAGWSAASATNFENMLKSIYVPNIQNGSEGTNGNWELATADAMIQIGVFTNTAAFFNTGVSLWNRRVPVYIYNSAMDGVDPKFPPGGYGGTGEGYCNPNTATCDPFGYFGQEDKKLVDGLFQETCRDLEHVQMGIDSIFTAAETARIQGTNLYAQQAPRLVAGLEFATKYLNEVPAGAVGPPITISTTDTWLCNSGTVTILLSQSHATVPVQAGMEIAYNELVNREGLSLPNTQQLLQSYRPMSYNATKAIAWETLTHANVGWSGIPH